MTGTDRRAGFSDCAQARRPQLRRMAYELCGDWHTAGDIVQNALAAQAQGGSGTGPHHEKVGGLPSIREFPGLRGPEIH